MLTEILTLVSAVLTFVAVIVMTTLGVLTIYKLMKRDPEQELARQNNQERSDSTQLKLIVIGIVSSILCIVSEVSGWVLTLIFQQDFSPISIEVNFGMCLFVLNNVLNFPVYLIVFFGNCIHFNPQGNVEIPLGPLQNGQWS